MGEFLRIQKIKQRTVVPCVNNESIRPRSILSKKRKNPARAGWLLGECGTFFGSCLFENHKLWGKGGLGAPFVAFRALVTYQISSAVYSAFSTEPFQFIFHVIGKRLGNLGDYSTGNIMRIFSWPGHETFALSLEANIVTDFCDEFLDGVLLTVFCFLWLGIPRVANIAMIRSSRPLCGLSSVNSDK